MKLFTFFILGVFSCSVMSGSLSSRVTSVGISEYDQYAFIMVEAPILELGACASDQRKLVLDFSDKRGELMYSTALAARLSGREVFVVYDSLCPDGVSYGRVIRLHVKDE
jgi:hypothetical protein